MWECADSSALSVQVHASKGHSFTIIALETRLLESADKSAHSQMVLECRDVSTARQMIEGAFRRLEQMPGYRLRENQVQLALLLSDLIAEGSTGAFEAPTGLGKSL